MSSRMLPAPMLGLPTETWRDNEDYRLENGGMGMCNTGSGFRCVCVLGGIGCNVDHVAIARENFERLKVGRLPAPGSVPKLPQKIFNLETDK